MITHTSMNPQYPSPTHHPPNLALLACPITQQHAQSFRLLLKSLKAKGQSMIKSIKIPTPVLNQMLNLIPPILTLRRTFTTGFKTRGSTLQKKHRSWKNNENLMI